MTIIAFTDPARPERFSTADDRPDMLDVVLGETVILRSDGHPITDITAVAVPSDDSYEPGEGDQIAITPLVVGRYHFNVKTNDGRDTPVSLIVCEPETLARIPDRSNSGHGAVNKRRVLRELGRFAPDFTGLAAQIENRNLAQYGA
jgi:hypothetical protein